ncbi:hypothetical protein RN001_006573 [Aquatica leii]|uniref:Uncharacterized protein n=1 Tax=Aquatica leii TaxID=1421715 RepID=A0AAN7PDU8_9COLE|nr:hypothetical protein RN001_006573 [Aquatica leii]
MSFKLDIDRLLVDELDYELHIRNVEIQGNVHDKRKMLRCSLKFEKMADTSLIRIASSDGKVELDVCEHKLGLLAAEVDSCGSVTLDNEVKRLSSRLIHVQDRLSRIVEGDVESRKEVLERKCQELLNILEAKVQPSTDARSNLRTNKENKDEASCSSDSSHHSSVDGEEQAAVVVDQHTVAPNFPTEDVRQSRPPTDYPPHAFSEADFLAAEQEEQLQNGNIQELNQSDVISTNEAESSVNEDDVKSCDVAEPDIEQSTEPEIPGPS